MLIKISIFCGRKECQAKKKRKKNWKSIYVVLQSKSIKKTRLKLSNHLPVLYVEHLGTILFVRLWDTNSTIFGNGLTWDKNTWRSQLRLMIAK